MNRVQVKPGKRNSVSEDPAGHSSRHCSRGTYDAIFRLTPASVAEKSFSLAFLIAEFLTNDADRERKDLSFGATSDRASGVVAAVPTPLLVSIDGPVAANTFCAALQNACKVNGRRQTNRHTHARCAVECAGESEVRGGVERNLMVTKGSQARSLPGRQLVHSVGAGSQRQTSLHGGSLRRPEFPPSATAVHPLHTGLRVLALPEVTAPHWDRSTRRGSTRTL